jgi:anti-sigma F factor
MPNNLKGNASFEVVIFMRKQRINQFSLVIQADEKNIQSILNFITQWLADNGMSEEKVSGAKCAVCEAVSNVIDHAYNDEFTANTIQVDAIVYEDNSVKIAVRDTGKGIADIEQAKQSLFSTGTPDKNSGMGFTVMDAFVDEIKVRSKPGKGTSVLLFTTLT